MAASSSAAAVPGLTRSDPHAPGIIRERGGRSVHYRDASGTEVTDTATLERIAALSIPPAWKDVWISPDPLGHIQATGVDSRGRTQYRYHPVWREQREAQKFTHMLRFARALPDLRTATVRDLDRPDLDRDRVAAAAVRLIDLGLFRIGGEKYAELDHHYGATTLQKQDVTLTRGGVTFDYIAKEGKRRIISINDDAVFAVVRDLLRSDSSFDDALLSGVRRRVAAAAVSRSEYVHCGPLWRTLHCEGIPNLERDRAHGIVPRRTRTRPRLSGAAKASSRLAFGKWRIGWAILRRWRAVPTSTRG